MKIVIESKSKVSQNTPQNEKCHRVQIRGVPKYSPPKMKIVIESKSKVSKNTPPKMKIVRESKSEVSQITPQNENCHRVQIWGVPENPPKMKIVIESESEVSQNITPKWKFS